MRFASYLIEGETSARIGVMYPGDGRMYDISLFGLNFADMNELIANMTPPQLTALGTAPVPDKGFLEPGSFVMAAPIPFPRQDVICLGFNYMDHAAELGTWKSPTTKRISPMRYIFQSA
jgi:hypothetical protein